jgi:predicted RNase H-like HicB family nuclease
MQMPTHSAATPVNKAETIENVHWEQINSYRWSILLIKDEEEDSYSAIVLNLPGIGSCGGTEAEAMRNVQEAIRGALESYKASGQEIPWKDAAGAEIPRGAKLKQITLNA